MVYQITLANTQSRGLRNDAKKLLRNDTSKSTTRKKFSKNGGLQFVNEGFDKMGNAVFVSVVGVL